MPTFKNISKIDGVKKWTVIFDLPTTDGIRKQKRLSGFNSKTEANLAYIAFMANYKPPEHIPAPTGTLDAAYNTYLKYKKTKIKESSYGEIESTYRNHIKSILGGKQLDMIKTPDIIEWQNHILSKNLGAYSRRKIHITLSQFFNHCIKFEILTSNPCQKVGNFKNDELKKEMLIWSEEEFSKFIAAADKDILFKAFFAFLYLTGCRRGEAFGLNWNDIKGNTVKINKSLGYHKLEGGYLMSTPKNIHSNREIIMPDNLITLLDELKEHYKKSEGFNEANYIFGNTRPLPPENVRRKLKEYCAKSEVKLIRLHDFRHSHASLLISKGQDIVTIARRLGHADIEMTLNRYAHLMPNKQKDLMSSLNIKL